VCFRSHGLHRTSQVPGEPIPYLCPALGSRPVRRPSPCRLRRCSPHLEYNEDTSTANISRINHTASVPAAYASCDALPHPHARLASGWWLTVAGRESNPLGFHRKVSALHIELPPFPRFILARPQNFRNAPRNPSTQFHLIYRCA
jgi:hypothetical protein